MCPEYPVVDSFKKAATALETLVDGFRFARPLGMQDGLLEQLQQHFIETAQFHDGAVVHLHERLDTEALCVILVAELFREGSLVIE